MTTVINPAMTLNSGGGSSGGGGGTGLPPIALTYAATTIVPSALTNWGTLIATGDTAFSFTGSPVEGQPVTVAVTASGGDRQITLPASVDIPTSSTTTSPVTVLSGTGTLFSFRWSVALSKWRLVALVSGY